MSFLPIDTELGQLELLETYEFYDKPVLFSCRNTTDNLFLAMLVNQERDTETWLYVGMSQRRFAHVRSGAIDLHDAFTRAESDIAFVVQTFLVPQKPTAVQHVRLSEIDVEWLPEPGERLDLPAVTLPTSEESLPRKAKQANRVFIALSLEFVNALKAEAPAAALSRILAALQEVISAIGESLKGRTSAVGQISHQTLAQTELSVLGVGPGSFRVELASANLVNLFGESTVADAMDALVDLMSLGANADELEVQLSKLKARVASRYLVFLQSISQSLRGARVEWAAPVEERQGSAYMSASVARVAVSAIELFEDRSVEYLDLVGRLIGGNLRTKRYELETREGTYRGEILGGAMESVRGATLGEFYLARIEQVTKVRPVTGDLDVKHNLADLQLYNSHPSDQGS